MSKFNQIIYIKTISFITAVGIAVFGIFFEFNQVLFFLAIVSVILSFTLDFYTVFFTRNYRLKTNTNDLFNHKFIVSPIDLIIKTIPIILLFTGLKDIYHYSFVIFSLAIIVNLIVFFLRKLLIIDNIIISDKYIRVNQEEITFITIEEITSIQYNGLFNSLTFFKKNSKRLGDISLSKFVNEDQERIKRRINELAKTNQIELSDNLVQFNLQ